MIEQKSLISKIGTDTTGCGIEISDDGIVRTGRLIGVVNRACFLVLKWLLLVEDLRRVR